MKTIKVLYLFIFLAIISQTVQAQPNFSAGILTGYQRGFGLQANAMVKGLGVDFPFEFRFSAGLDLINPGNALDARRIFINNATNGTPEKSGRSLDFKLDFMMPGMLFGAGNSYVIFGPRYSAFKGNFSFIGGNEEFDITSRQWGIGGGIENHFSMIGNMDLVFALGLDYYFPSTLSGHDTAYSPDNDNVNPRNDNLNDDLPFTYKVADKAIRQPRFMPMLMVGFNFSL